MRHVDIFAGILVGGYGRRLGGMDKARLRAGDISFVERLSAALTPAVQEVLLSGRAEQSYPEVAARLVPDRRVDSGPLAGLEVLLLEAPVTWCFLVGCDMPDVDADVLAQLASARSDTARLVIARTEAGLEPTCALYHRDLAPRVSALLDAGRRAAYALAREVETIEVELPPPLASRLRNVNRAEDL